MTGDRNMEKPVRETSKHKNKKKIGEITRNEDKTELRFEYGP